MGLQITKDNRPRNHRQTQCLCLGRPFERTYRISQNLRVLQYSSTLQLGRIPKTSIQVAPRRKEIEDDHLPNPGVGKHWFRSGGVCNTAWEDRLSELTDYSIIQGDCNVPKNYRENTKLAYWVGTQRREYRLHQEEQNRIL
jgi:hypothetical protein